MDPLECVSDDFLSCSICFESFRDCIPKMLISCGHTFCGSCLSKIVSNQEIVCPNCLQSTLLLSESVSELPTNFLVKSMVEQKRSLIEKGKQKIALCKEHSRKLELFCEREDCMKLICASCETQHKGHPYKFIDNAVTSYRRLLTERADVMRGIEQQINFETEFVENSIINIHHQKETATASIKQTTNKIRAWILEKEETLLDDINTETLKALSLLENRHQNLLHTKKTIDSFEKQLNENNSDKFGFLENVGLHMQQINQIITENSIDYHTTRIKCLIEFQSIEESTLKPLVTNFGKIMANLADTLEQPHDAPSPSMQIPSPFPQIPSQMPIDSSPAPHFIRNNYYKQPTPSAMMRNFGPILGNRLGCLSNPHFVTVVPKEWFLNNDNGSKFSNEDVVVISDTNNNRIVLIEKTKQREWIIGTFGGLRAPKGVAVTKRLFSPHLILYVADSENNRVRAFDVETSNYVMGFTNEYISKPCGITVNQQNGQLIVANSTSITIHLGCQNLEDKFRFGELIRVISNQDFELDHPRDVAVNSYGHLIVSSGKRVDIFDSEYNFVKSLGLKGEFFGVCVDEMDNILVCDTSTHKVQMFNHEGIWFRSFGQGSFRNHLGIHVTLSTGDIYVVNGNGRIIAFCYSR